MGRVEDKLRSSPARPADRAVAMRLRWPRRAPTSSRWTSASRCRPPATTWPRPRTWSTHARRSRRSGVGASPSRPTSGTSSSSRRRSGRSCRDRARRHRHRERRSRPVRGGPAARGLAGHDRHQPHRRLQHPGDRRAVDGRARRRRCDRDDQLDGRSARDPRSVPGVTRVRRLEARPGRADAVLRQQPGGALHPGEHRPPDRGGDAHDRHCRRSTRSSRRIPSSSPMSPTPCRSASSRSTTSPARSSTWSPRTAATSPARP